MFFTLMDENSFVGLQTRRYGQVTFVTAKTVPCDDFYGSDSLVLNPKENKMVLELELEHEKAVAWIKQDIFPSNSAALSLLRDAYLMSSDNIISKISVLPCFDEAHH